MSKNEKNIMISLKKESLFSFLFLVLFFFSQSSIAQSFKHYLSSKETNAENGEIVNLNVFSELAKDNLDAWPVKVAVKVDKPLQLLTQAEHVILDEGQYSRYVPLKAFAPKYIESDTFYRIIVTYTASSGKIIGTDTCRVYIKRVKRAHLFTVQQNVLLDKSKDSLVVGVRVVNGGNTAEKIKVVARLPEIASSDYYVIINKTLPAYADTIIYLKHKATKSMFRYKTFQATFTGLFGDGNVFGSAVVYVQVASSSRSYLENNKLYKEADGTPNMITACARYIGNPFENYQLYGGSSLQFENSLIRYNADVTVWKNGVIKPLVRNTYLNFEKNGVGVTVGNIQKNSELNLNGKGASFYKEDLVTKNRVEVGVLESGYNLITSERIGEFNKGRSAWMNIKKGSKQVRSNTMLLYDRSAFSFTEVALANTELSFEKNGRIVTLIGAGGYSWDTRGIDKARPGFAGGLGYAKSFGKLYVSSNNYLSSAYFPGFRRGAVALDERVSLSLDKKSIWLACNYFNFTPEYLPGSVGSFNSQYGNATTSAGIDIGGLGAVSLGLSISGNQQSNNYGTFLGVSDDDSKLQSLRGKVTLQYSNTITQMFAMFSTENGGYTTSLSPEVKFQSNNMFTFRYKFFTLSALYRVGYYYLTEVFNSLRYNNDKFTMLTISPMLEKQFLKDRLNVMVGGSYSSNTIFGNNLMVNTRITYNIFRSSKVYAGLDYNEYNFGNNKNMLRNYEVGFIQELPPAKINLFRGSELKVSVYYDMNSNGILDEGDEPASGRSVNINDILMMTDGDGEVELKHVPDTAFDVRVAPSREWHAPAQTVEVKGKTQVNVLLQKASKIAGNINYQYDKYSYEIVKIKHGVTIQARGENNEKYTTKTDHNGNFILYLPEGRFVLSVTNLTKEVECINDNVMVSTDNTDPADVEFLLKIKSRKLDVKKFGTYSMNKE